jgi:hypothetical protein
MKKRLIILASTLVVAASVAATASVAAAALGSDGSAVEHELAQAREATAKYHDVANAVADGYVPFSDCVAGPGLGTMGIHYAKPSLLGGGLDARHPELLLYVPSDDGLRLVGVEYFKIDADQNLTTDDDRPSLFGQPFDGPMEGHQPGMPRHYDLHVWLWQANPAGMFAQFNPNVSC